MIAALVIMALILLNGLFSLAEFAIVSARPARLKALSAKRRRGAASALELSTELGRLLSTVQVGITLVGVMTGAIGGVAFGASLTEMLEDGGLSPQLAETLGYGATVAVITYVTIIAGELVPKSLALRNAEMIACRLAPLMKTLARLAAPAVWLLEASARLLFKPFGKWIRPAASVTEEEIRFLITEAARTGVIETGERHLITRVMRLADSSVRAVMTPGTKVDWIDLADDPKEIEALLVKTRHSRLPVGNGSQDAIIGVAETRGLLADLLADKPLDVAAHIRKAPTIAETVDALDVLAILREAEVPMALVYEEYGHFEGLVTPYDILETIVGVFGTDETEPEPYAFKRDDDSWLLSGALPVHEMAELLALPLPRRRGYQTVAGFALAQLRQLPKIGESFMVPGWRFEIVDLDGRRIDKVLATRATP